MIAKSTANLTQRIQHLLEERQQHAEALARIDQILGGVSAALKGASVASANGKNLVAGSLAPQSPAVKGKKRRRGRGHFSMSAQESILSFVKQQRNPTTAEINRHLKGEGRSSSANNALGKLVGEKNLKRTPLGKGIRGSRYSLA
jgi:hypothetical protein